MCILPQEEQNKNSNNSPHGNRVPERALGACKHNWESLESLRPGASGQAVTSLDWVRPRYLAHVGVKVKDNFVAGPTPSCNEAHSL